jgi:AraC-like DNA-binding protein
VVGDVTQVDFPASYLGLSPKRRIYDKDPVDAAMHWLSCFEPLDAQDGSLGDIGELSRGIFRSLISEDLSFEQCCAAMGIGPRHLRESLAAEGVTYRRLRKFALIERVRPYLEAEANADDMALELGYSDARSLRRALKNATGLSLSEMRLPGGRVDSLRRDGLVGNLRRELAQMS